MDNYFVTMPGAVIRRDVFDNLVSLFFADYKLTDGKIDTTMKIIYDDLQTRPTIEGVFGTYLFGLRNNVQEVASVWGQGKMCTLEADLKVLKSKGIKLEPEMTSKPVGAQMAPVCAGPARAQYQVRVNQGYIGSVGPSGQIARYAT
jgi:hypothetical protein